jgi:hypothetical protein
MASTGPITKNTDTLALGLAQVRVGQAETYVGNINPQLNSSDSIGALATTKFMHSIEYWRHESGFPAIEDYVLPLRSAASLEVAFEELTPFNLALAHGQDPIDLSLTDTHSGEVALGNLAAPDYMRMEARYTFPDGVHYMDIIFPRAQVTSSPEIDLQKEDNVAVTIMFESKRADSEVSGGSSAWDNKPLGRISFT